jgi:hypothetical protein
MCYIFKKIIFSNCIFKEHIDATYILHLENNGRLDHIVDQLSKYQPTKIVYICFNKGFKKCNKKNFIKNSLFDIVDANLNIFKHAKKNNYNNILILEDDFIFTNKIKNKININNIYNFLEKNKNKKFMYSLGTLPIIVIPYNSYTYRTLIFGCSHAVIYSKQIRNKYLLINQQKINDWDLFKLNKMKKYCYMYYTPLCYQLFQQSENQKNWLISCNNIFWKFLVKLSYFFIKILKLDTYYEPGYTYVYNFSKIFSFIIFMIFILFIISFK